MVDAVVIDEKDNVATAVRACEVDEIVETNLKHEIRLLQVIPKGHKVATRDIEANAPVVKYGETICLAREPIKKGSHVHTHNIIDVLTQRMEAR